MRLVAIYTFAGCSLLSGCALTINGTELTPTGLLRAGLENFAREQGRKVRSTLASGRATRLQQALTEEAVSGDKPLPKQIVSLIETDYQEVINELSDRIRRIQKGAAASDYLNAKGPMRTPTLVVVNDTDQVNAWNRDDPLEPQVFVPATLIVRSLLRLQVEQQESMKEAGDIYIKASMGFTSYVPPLELEEMLRLVLAHEVTHIWLHGPGLDVRSREIEADAWGVALSSSMSEPFAFRAKATKMVLSGGFSTHDPFDLALLTSRSGFEVLEYLYGDQGILAQSADRQSLPERKKSVEAKYSEVYERYISSLKDTDIALFALMRKIL